MRILLNPAGGERRAKEPIHGGTDHRGENRRLKHLVADQSLELQALKAALGKKW
jgi:hypothetical protein